MQRIPFRCICVSTNVRIGRDQATAIPRLSFLFLEEHITSYIEMLLSTEESTMILQLTCFRSIMNRHYLH